MLRTCEGTGRDARRREASPEPGGYRVGEGHPASPFMRVRKLECAANVDMPQRRELFGAKGARPRCCARVRGAAGACARQGLPWAWMLWCFADCRCQICQTQQWCHLVSLPGTYFLAKHSWAG